jgi:hypothetical protein
MCVYRNDGVLELEALIKLWAKKLVLTTDQERAPRGASDIQYEIKWNKVKIQHHEPTYNDASNPPSPKTTVLFKSTYRNASDREQTNKFRAERSTTSRAELTVLEGVCLPVDGVRVPLPAHVAAANAGFPPTLSVCKLDRKCWEEKLTWAVNTEITVDPHQTTHAQMVVEEKQWSGNFSITTTIRGSVKFVARRGNGELITSSVGKIHSICQSAIDSGLNIPGMALIHDGVRFLTTGLLHFRYGVEQNVHIQNVEMMEEEDDSDEYSNYGY